MPFEGVVEALGDGRFRANRTGWSCDAGPTAVAAAATRSRSSSRAGRSCSTTARSSSPTAQDPREFDAVVVKSPRCEPRLFDAWAARTVHIDAPGSTSANLPSLGHVHCPRPIFPLDDDVPFEPVVELFSRPRYGVDTSVTGAARPVA